jgi:hypothetical protein
VRYIPDWLSLSEARELPVASGHSASEAETDICRALREGKIRFRRAFERVTFRGHTVDPEVFRRMTFKDPSRFRLLVPTDLTTGEMDWENSQPRKPWPLGEGYFAHIARLELSSGDIERVLRLRVGEVPTETPTPQEAPQEESQKATPPEEAPEEKPGAALQPSAADEVVSQPSAAEIDEIHSEARSRAAQKAGRASGAARRAQAMPWKAWVTAQAPAMRLKHPTATQEDLADKLIAQATKEGIELPQRKTVVTHLSTLERADKLHKRTTASRTPRS